MAISLGILTQHFQTFSFIVTTQTTMQTRWNFTSSGSFCGFLQRFCRAGVPDVSSFSSSPWTLVGYIYHENIHKANSEVLKYELFQATTAIIKHSYFHIPMFCNPNFPTCFPHLGWLQSHTIPIFPPCKRCLKLEPLTIHLGFPTNDGLSQWEFQDPKMQVR